MGEHHKLSSDRDVEVRLECLRRAIEGGPWQLQSEDGTVRAGTSETIVEVAQKFYWFATARRGDGDE